MEHDIAKALEVWTLQNLVNASIAGGVLACLLAVIQDYYRSLEKHLSVRIAGEPWRLMRIVVVDALLGAVVLVGYLVLNPDIMADIKIAVPFQPIATVLFSVALVLRLFHGGHDCGTRNFFRAVYLMMAANVMNMAGFTFVAEAPSSAYLKIHPSPFWEYVKTHLRSNAAPHGLELAQLTFYVALPALMLVFAWGLVSALRQLRAGRDA